MDKNELKKLLKHPAISTTWRCMKFPLTAANRIYTGQVIRSSASSVSNYRSACRGKSNPDFIHKLRAVEEELDETLFFYKMLAEFNSDFKKELRELYKEGNELLSIIVASINTTIRNMEKAQILKIRNRQYKI